MVRLSILHATLVGLSLAAAVALPAVGQTAPPTRTAPAAPQTAAASTTAATFLPVVAASNQFEIESSTLALSKSGSKAVKDFANRMVVDHNLAGSKFKQALTDAKLSPPPEKLDAKHQAILDKLRAANGAAFDAAYIEAQTSAHIEAVDLFKAYAKDGDNPRLKAFAADVLPTLQGHLEHVKKLK
jgi:putative membrane protein